MSRLSSTNFQFVQTFLVASVSCECIMKILHVLKRQKQYLNLVFCNYIIYWDYALSYASSNELTVYRSSYIYYTQRISLQCVKACDTSGYLIACKNSCTAHT